MLRNLLILPDGTELFSGTDTVNAIKSVTLTQCVNGSEELMLGSACANMLEAQLLTPNGGLTLTAGDVVTLYKVEDGDTRHKVGVFTLEKPTRTSANTMKLTGYDNVARLDKDLTTWLSSLTGWPYNILTFASMVCGACGLSFIPGDVPNRDFSVGEFSSNGVTGRQLMKWVGEVTCSFCRANADGKIELGWYAPLTTHAIGYRQGQFDEIFYDKYIEELAFSSSDIAVAEGTSGTGDVSVDSDRFTVTDDGQGNVVIVVDGCIETLPYFQNGLNYEDYSVRRVDAVQLQLGAGEDAYRWPPVEEDANIYIISGNPLLQSASTAMLGVLDKIKARLSEVSYTPCRVSAPATLQVKAGDILSITDKNGKKLTVYAMTAKTAGQKLTIECTGSHRRDSTTAQNNQSVSQVAQNIAQNVATDAAKKAVDGQTQQDIFNKLTENGKLQGLYMEDGQLYINASYLMSGVIDAAVVRVVNLIAEKLQSARGDSVLKINGAFLNLVYKNFLGIDLSNTGFLPSIGVIDRNEDGSIISGSTYTGSNIYFQYQGSPGNTMGFGFSRSSGKPYIELPGTDGYKYVSWKDNGDGTFTLIGK